jgi:formylglycine-generating enzyme required for sulfatase activity
VYSDLFSDQLETGDLAGWSGVSDREEIEVLLPGGVSLVMVRVSVGGFTMGSPAGERGRLEDEGPQRPVYFSGDFYVARFEVTQAQWQAVTGAPPPPSCGVGAHLPVCDVSWEGVAGPGGFVDQLNAHLAATGQSGAGTYRLPTEAEWEAAARAGTMTRYSHGDVLECGDLCEACAAHEGAMWWCGNSGGGAHPVGGKLPNAFGLNDMHGNVWEWVGDWHSPYLAGERWNPVGPLSGAQRVTRGGGWSSDAKDCRSARRYPLDPTTGNPAGGFRLVRSR